MENNGGEIIDNGFLLTLFVALQVLDGLSTAAVLSTGLASEGNPLFQWMAGVIGEGLAWIAILWIKIAVVALVWYLAEAYGRKARPMLYAVTAWMLFVVVHNFSMYAAIS